MEEMIGEVQEMPEPESAPEASPDISEETYQEPSDNGETYQEPSASEDTYQESDDIEQAVDGTEEIVEPDVPERTDTLLDAIEEENSIQTASEIAQPLVPIKGYRDWNYGIVVHFKVYPYGAGYWMDTSEGCSEPEDLEAWYSRMSSLVGDTLGDFYIVSITDDDGIEVYNRETYVEPVQPSVPIEGYRDWNYGIVIYFEVYPYGAGYWMNTSENLSEPEDLEAWYSRMTSLVGDTIKDFHILTVIDDDGKEVYNRETYTDPGNEPGGDNPVHDGSGEYLEILEAIHSELEAIKDADKENHLLMADRYEEMFNMQAVETGSSIIICVALFIIVAELAFREIFARLK